MKSCAGWKRQVGNDFEESTVPPALVVVLPLTAYVLVEHNAWLGSR